MKIVVYWENGSTTATVAKPSTIIKVKVSTLICFLSNKPEWMLSFLQEMGAKVHHLTLQLSTMTFLTVEKRICYTLLMLSQDIGSDTSDGLKISVRLTDQELANLVGT